MYLYNKFLASSKQWVGNEVGPQYALLWENHQIWQKIRKKLLALNLFLHDTTTDFEYLYKYVSSLLANITSQFFLQTDYFWNRYMGFFNRNELESKVYTIMIYVYDYECKSNKNQKTICPQEILPYHQNKMYLFIY